MRLIAYVRLVYHTSETDGITVYAKCNRFLPSCEKLQAELEWIGYSTEPLFFGLESITAKCVFEGNGTEEGVQSAEQLLQNNWHLLEDQIQEARIEGVDVYTTDAFSVCKKLFYAQENDPLASVSLTEKIISEENFHALQDQGYVTMECLKYNGRIQEIIEEATSSLAGRDDNDMTSSIKGMQFVLRIHVDKQDRNAPRRLQVVLSWASDLQVFTF